MYKWRDVKFKLRKFLLGDPFTISVTDSNRFRAGERFRYGDTRLRILAVDDNATLSVARALTFKQQIAKLLIKMLEWSPRQQALDRLYQTRVGPGQAQGRYERPAGRYSRGTRT